MQTLMVLMKTRSVLWSIRKTLLVLCLGLICFPLFVRAEAGESATPREHAQQLADQGMALNDNSDEEADFYRQAIRLDPTYAAAYFNLGFVYQSRGDLEKAIDPYSRCVQLDGKRADAHRNLAACLLAVRRDAALYEVRHHMNQAIEIQEELPSSKQMPALDQQRAAILDVERRIHELLKPVVSERYTSRMIIEALSRPVTRGGMGVYEGPRLPLLLFAAEEVRIVPRMKDQLHALAEALKSRELASLRFVIEGHADGRGRAAGNLEISRRRAEAIREWLVCKGGVDAARLCVEAYGEDHPIYPNDSSQGYRFNRRIEIVKRFVP